MGIKLSRYRVKASRCPPWELQVKQQRESLVCDASWSMDWSWAPKLNTENRRHTWRKPMGQTAPGKIGTTGVRLWESTHRNKDGRRIVKLINENWCHNWQYKHQKWAIRSTIQNQPTESKVREYTPTGTRNIVRHWSQPLRIDVTKDSLRNVRNGDHRPKGNSANNHFE